MAQHKVMMKLPARELKRADAVFTVYRDGKKYGTLKVSNGAIVWFPRSTTNGKKMRWQKFHDLMCATTTRVEKR